ncbi:hypothetical protein Ahy_B07g086478 [Arachis hypogaea]|uniref:Aminotransferase-like plant mobile domain-containing protein n=1 Tax=Arachis hypogaea TaxID=3818 RepID=A0A444Y9Z9_ARAHY|nr:hypothetical protein Ahy_B07g086478 [Arachis hypogaea]
MPATADATTLRQYMKCYIMLLIGGYLMIDKSNNQVHIKWLPSFEDFERLIGMGQQSKDQFDQRVLRWRLLLDWLQLHENQEMDDCSTLVYFNIVGFHHIDWVKFQFDGQ